jgi:hypothetical protein
MLEILEFDENLREVVWTKRGGNFLLIESKVLLK